MPDPNEAARNVNAAVEMARRGDLSGAFSLLRKGQMGPSTAPGDDPAYPPQRLGTSLGDTSAGGGDAGTSPGDSYWPYYPPTAAPQFPPPAPPVQLPAGWYPDPFDGIGWRWWNGLGWTTLTQG
jgi:hypothetical protein